MNKTSFRTFRKDPRVLVTVPLLLLTATSLVYYLVQRSKELSPEALSSRLLLFVLWNINLIFILGILFVLLRSAIKLLVERQRGILGSRFRSKLVATYIATSLLPICLLFFVATDLLRVSIDRWFNTPVRKLLENGEKIAEISQQQSLANAMRASEELISSISEEELSIDPELDHVLSFHNVDLVGFYVDGAVIKLKANPRSPIHEIDEPSERFFEQVSTTGSAQKIDSAASGKWIRYAIRQGGAGSRRAAIAGVFIPNTLRTMIDENIVAHKNFQQLFAQRPALKASQTSLFLTVTLTVLFGALWTAIYVSRRITDPIRALAEATRTLAEGRFDHRVGVKATDELGVLIDSFNAMASQLESQRQALTASSDAMQTANSRLDEERAYLSTVLESVATGIVTFTERFELLSINRAALRILQIPPPAPMTKLEDLFAGDLSPLRDYLGEASARGPRAREITLIHGGELRYVELSAARLENIGGWVLAMEDSTQLVQAQKLAAWSEAARRIAHEIKNPLTPIRLSAERIAKKFRQNDPNTGKAIEDGCRTIVAEVGQLQRMVDEFSRFARMPAIHLQRTKLSEIFDQVATLYSGVKASVKITVRVDPSLEVLVDPEQIRRALINLLDNAVEATSEGEIVVAARSTENSLVIEVTDPGRGVPDSNKEKLFLPYFSTKGEGTGLGLAIVHRIVKDHDGRISVHDNSPHGTRFEIELPA